MRDELTETIEARADTAAEVRVPLSRLPAVARPLAALRRIVARDAGDDGTRRPALRLRLRLPSPPSYGQTFFLFVVLPSLAALVYLFAFASDQFVAEARFAVRATQFAPTVDTDSKSALSAVTAGGLPVIAGQDAYVVANYVRSPAVFADLDSAVDPRRLFTRPEADFWARLPADASLEELTDYWRGMVRTYVDGPSGVVSVTVRAFRPDDARDLLRSIVAASEKLVNTLSQRARDDAMAASEAEVRRTEGLVRSALDDMRAYRDQVGFIDPTTAAASASQLLLQAMSEKIRLESDYFVALRAMSPDAPTVVAQKARIDALDRQIDQLKGRLTGAGGGEAPIARSLVRYEELELKRVFAEKLFDLANRALERARQRAERQNVYLSVFVAPMLPEEARFPQRVRLGILIPILLLVVWGILALTTAAIEDHTY